MRTLALLVALAGCTTLQPLVNTPATRAVQAPPPATVAPLGPVPQVMFGQHAYANLTTCDGEKPAGYWTNPHPFPIRLAMVQLWVGIDWNGWPADVALTAVVPVLGNDSIVAQYTQDRYTEPWGEMREVTDLRPNGPVLQPGEHIGFHFRCTAFGRGPRKNPVNGHASAWIWWLPL